jgi:hypothetical protein
MPTNNLVTRLEEEMTDGMLTYGIFEATYDWGLTFSWGSFWPELRGTSCSLLFLSVDRWGNWTRDDFADVYTVSGSLN